MAPANVWPESQRPLRVWLVRLWPVRLWPVRIRPLPLRPVPMRPDVTAVGNHRSPVSFRLVSPRRVPDQPVPPVLSPV